MAGKKITDLTSGSLSTLPISGITVVSYSGNTFQHPLNHLRNVLVDSGSHYFTGSQYIIGNLELTETVSASYFIGDGSQLINLPNNNIDTSSFATTGSNTFNGYQTINGSLNIKGVSETIDINSGFGGDKTFNYTSGSIFFITGLTNNGVWNVNDVPLTNNNSTTITFVIKQESIPYSGSEYRINDSNISIKWSNGEIPTGSANKTDVIGLTLFRIGDGWDSIGSLSSFG